MHSVEQVMYIRRTGIIGRASAVCIDYWKWAGTSVNSTGPSHFDLELGQRNFCISRTLQCTGLSPLCFWGATHSIKSCIVALDSGWRHLQ